MIQDTSLEIYLKSIYPKLEARQRPVLHYLRSASVPQTNAEIKEALGWEINQVTPRTKELRDLGLVIDAGRRRCTVTGNNAHAWRAKYPVLPPARKVEEKKEVEVDPQNLFQ